MATILKFDCRLPGMGLPTTAYAARMPNPMGNLRSASYAGGFGHFRPYRTLTGGSLGAFVLLASRRRSQIASRGLYVKATGAIGRNAQQGDALASEAEADQKYSIADQVARFARAKADQNERYLNISSVYDGAFLKGRQVLVVGANKGLGLNIVQELAKQGAKAIATCRKSSSELDDAGASQIITGVEVTSLESLNKMCEQITDQLDYIIFVAGYFPDIVDTLDSINDAEALTQLDICALGPLRCVSALKKAKLLKGSKVAIITSQAGSTEWRFTQNKDKGGDYGHHMSRAACNIGAALMSEELKLEQVPIVMLHPGFNRTTMTAKYSHIWDIEGAVEPDEGAKRVLYEVGQIDMDSSGNFVNCEDGLLIPW